jgi:RNA polymerase sigma-70 factor (ECF subfamily)
VSDEEIIILFEKRSETAIAETAKKYGSFCRTIAYNILHSASDAEECENETYFRTWNAIPPTHPALFSAFLGKITRNLSLNKLQKQTAEKRGGGELAAALDELEYCISDNFSPEKAVENELTVKTINAFLKTLKPLHRKIFVRRYFYINSIETIAYDFGISVTNIKQILFRTREKLKAVLQKEGVMP